jgi:hypothetical protein
MIRARLATWPTKSAFEKGLAGNVGIGPKYFLLRQRVTAYPDM